MSILNRKLLNTKMVPALGIKSLSQMGFFYCCCCCTRKWVFWNLRSEEKEKEKQKSEELVCGWFDWDKSAEDCVKNTVDRRCRQKSIRWNLTCFTIRQKKLTLRANVVTKIWSSDLDHQFSGASCTFYLLHLSFLWNLEISSIFPLSWIWLL